MTLEYTLDELKAEHHTLEQKLRDLQRAKYLTAEVQAEINRIKKLKLRTKEMMETMRPAR